MVAIRRPGEKFGNKRSNVRVLGMVMYNKKEPAIERRVTQGRSAVEVEGLI